MAAGLSGGGPQTVRRAARVTGVVQGVGFRPFVHALAAELGLTGFVGNDAEGVFAEVEGPPGLVEEFLGALPTRAPALAVVESVTSRAAEPLGSKDFVIVESRDGSSGRVALIPPDTAACPACLAEVDDPSDRRYRYPFTACTYCGPRYTIVTGLPYDRPSTTMAGFPLCPDCLREYEDPSDRRFHAQPTACPACGPRLAFGDGDDAAEPACTGDAALAAAQDVLHAGGIVAIKGIGGYHLACDPGQPHAVEALRQRKRRTDKPFALLVRDAEVAAELVRCGPDVAAALASPAAPIVLAPADLGDPQVAQLSARVAPGNGFLGVFVPYSPLHHLLLRAHPDRPGRRPLRMLVLTSGNVSDEPICTDPREARERLAGIADAFLDHDRPIHVPCDDSVVRVVDGGLQPVRRSRGFAPLPLRIPVDAPPSLAVGGELKTAICLAQGERAWLSQHIGDTRNLETLDLLARIAATLADLTRVAPQVVVADQHPDYLSRRWAEGRAAASDADLVLVQHHHAHVAALMAEHAVPPGEPVLGVAFDGTGFGADGTIWGGEFLLATYAHAERVGHLRPVALPGGDAAIRHPSRVALAHLTAAGVAAEDDLPPVAATTQVERRVVLRMLQTGAGCVPTTSMGRLFDAVASLLDVRHEVSYEGQAAIELEALAARQASGTDDDARWRLDVHRSGPGTDGPWLLDPAPAIRAAVAAVRSGAPVPRAARAFHEAVAQAVADCAVRVRSDTGVRTVGLTGGVFQNAVLTAACRSRLTVAGFDVLVHRAVPPSDAGLALGQVVVAASGGGLRRPRGGG